MSKRREVWASLVGGAVGLGGTLVGLADEPSLPPGILYYSTAAPAIDQEGPTPGAPAPRILPNAQPTTLPEVKPSPESAIAPTPPRPPEDAPRIANASDRTAPSVPRVPENARPTEPVAPLPGPSATSPVPVNSMAHAMSLVGECQERFRRVQDYTCTFHKRERIEGRLTAPHMMAMKVRSQPFSIYFKFHKPNPGREAIYVTGRYNGKIIAHDVGVAKVVAGTMKLDPKGSMAMEDQRHPITDAGLGHLIETIATRWATELKQDETRVTIHTTARVNNRPCTMIETMHPKRRPELLFHQVKVYIDQELGLPIRFEAYDWPTRPGNKPELVEEYSYLNLKLNVGLRDEDFDPTNKTYAYGRF